MVEGMHMEKLQKYNSEKFSAQTALNQINSLCDDSSFVQSLSYPGTPNVQGVLDNKIICGFGKITGQNVGILAQNFDANNGGVDVVSVNMAAATVEKATKSGMPIIFMFDSAGLDLKFGVTAMDAYSKLIRTVVRSSGVVPMIGALLGPCIGVQGMLASALDFLVAVKDKAQLGCYSEFVLEANGAFNKENAFYRNGVQFVEDSQEEAFSTIQNLLNYLPANNLQKAIDMASVENAIGDTYGSMEELIAGVFDPGSLLKLYEGRNRFLGFGRLAGKSVAIVGGGDGDKGLCMGCCNSFARFVETANCFNLPIITFTNANGFVLDNTQEERGLLRAGTRLAFAYGQAVVPMISIITGKAVGSGYVILSSKGMGHDYVFALPDAFISPVDEEAGIRICYSKRMSGVDNPEQVRAQLKDEYAQTFASPFEVVKQGVIDDILLPSQIRQNLVSALGVISSKRDSMLPKKHSNMPL